MKRRPRPSAGTDDIKIGKCIRQIRNARGLSLSDVGRQMDLSYQQVQKYELGQNRISAARLNQLMDIFEVPWTYFFDENQSRLLRFFLDCEETQSIDDLWREFPDELRIHLYALVSFLGEALEKNG